MRALFFLNTKRSVNADVVILYFTDTLGRDELGGALQAIIRWKIAPSSNFIAHNARTKADVQFQSPL